jgi:hypothetical protein
LLDLRIDTVILDAPRQGICRNDTDAGREDSQ